ncbi:uncharacterized protein LOC111039683 [Myzus persicae]|uniref:uncharacterized protein LOC111039683 n=1 Tax=Myzus persicae TaxID=13164 RepID=UPI000B937778|nr:uncharacterized protein LOC111039683 [Myzus persicae]
MVELRYKETSRADVISLFHSNKLQLVVNDKLSSMLKCIVSMTDPHIGEYFICKKCKHVMLTRETALQHRGCRKNVLLETFIPEEKIYSCKTCGRYFDNEEQFKNHEDLHKRIGNLDVTKLKPVNL